MVGFGIRTRTSRPGVDFRLVCNRAGVIPNTNHLDSETGHDKNTSMLCFNCPVFISVGQSQKTNGRWVVRSLQNCHNHPYLSPVSKPFLHSNTEMTETAQFFTKKFHKVGVPICKVAQVLQEEGNFDKKDCYNYMSKLRAELIDEGDARAVLTYCQKMKKEDPDFFYSMTVDGGGRMENFFWVDSYSRMCYQVFGDVITFDTTYRTNKYKMPFAPFVGWLAGLYDIRAKWVPVYCRDTFFAGMSTTQRSESINSFFDKFVHSGTTLCEFVGQFQEALSSRIKESQKEDYYTRHKECILKLGSPLERHASKVYTRKVFSIFRKELRQVYEYKKEEVKREGPQVTYRVIRHVEDTVDTRQKYREVVFDHDLRTASCSCREFEFRGILCRHALMVLVHEGLDKIPSENILTRWTKNANRLLDCTLVPSNEGDAAMLRLHHFNRASRMLQDTVKVSHEAYMLVIGTFKDLYLQASRVAYGDIETTTNEDISNIIEIDQGYIGDPCVAKTKGRPKVGSAGSCSGRYKGGFELAMEKVRTCRGCGERGHDKRNCATKSSKKHKGLN